MFKKLKRAIIEFLGGSADRIYPVSYQAVDIVVIDKSLNEILMGSKWKDKSCTVIKNEIRFLGGFVDPKDNSLEAAAVRELKEEAGPNLEISKPVYVGSFRVDDPRYRDSQDKIMSAVFVCERIYGFARGGDDIAVTEWINIEVLKRQYEKMTIAKEHIPLIELLIQKGII